MIKEFETLIELTKVSEKTKDQNLLVFEIAELMANRERKLEEKIKKLEENNTKLVDENRKLKNENLVLTSTASNLRQDVDRISRDNIKLINENSWLKYRINNPKRIKPVYFDEYFKL